MQLRHGLLPAAIHLSSVRVHFWTALGRMVDHSLRTDRLGLTYEVSGYLEDKI